MKKLSLILCISLLLFSVQQATADDKPAAGPGFEIGAFGGYNMLLNNNDQIQSPTKGGIAFGAKAAFVMPVISAGLSVGYFPIYHANWSVASVSYDYTSYVVPIDAFAQLSLGPIYLLGGVGIYSLHSTISPTVTIANSTGSSSKFGYELGAGFTFGTAPVNFELGGLYQQITGNGNWNPSMFSILAGINFVFNM